MTPQSPENHFLDLGMPFEAMSPATNSCNNELGSNQN
eukprot:CAMPEP_0204239212 /NCGR_PEP_ID=MMETSP0361-20130328/94264_1 /ASSEMBLY_ACC=CAM_ASM_000343 /TAXON_ID=268821 /ORGANISM="Scrippsiella Hangoei, Strain SHTV-5" /LENGTH=36 /DNA_ID= /DNA_START= /DNA_END= /DNA_ORIENTATION=